MSERIKKSCQSTIITLAGSFLTIGQKRLLTAQAVADLRYQMGRAFDLEDWAEAKETDQKLCLVRSGVGDGHQTGARGFVVDALLFIGGEFKMEALDGIAFIGDGDDQGFWSVGIWQPLF